MSTSYGLWVIFFPLLLFAAGPDFSVEEVLASLKNGNASQLARHMDDRIDLTLPGKSDNYSRVQTEMILKDFFTANPVRDFQVKHKGDSEGAAFCFGVLITQKGSFRTKFYMKVKGDRQVLQEIGFEKLD